MVCVCVYGEGWSGGGAGGDDVKQCIRNCNTISSERFHECLCVLHVKWRMEQDLLLCSFVGMQYVHVCIQVCYICVWCSAVDISEQQFLWL